MSDLRMVDGRIVEFGKRCPGCSNPDLRRITDHNFIAQHGDAWECGWCMIHNHGAGIWTDYAVRAYNKHWINQLREFGYPREADAIEKEQCHEQMD